MTTEKSPSIVLFLDFDGVTHPEPCLQEQLFCYLVRIEDVLREHPQVEVVISSSWRDEYSLEQLRALFAADMAERIVGITPSIKRPSSTWQPGQVPEFEREWEIETWLKENRRWDTHWIAIDDRPYWFRPNSVNLLRTHSRIGFTLDDKVTLQAMLLARS